jgi:hypothetical protein
MHLENRRSFTGLVRSNLTLSAKCDSVAASKFGISALDPLALVTNGRSKPT